MNDRPYKYEIHVVSSKGDEVRSQLDYELKQLEYSHLVKVQRAITEAITGALLDLGDKRAAEKIG